MAYIPVQDALLWPLLAILLFALAQGRSPLATILAAPLCVTLGEASYGLYILHWPLHIGLDRLGLLSPLAGGWPSFVAYAGLAVACAFLSLSLVEMPARRAVRSLLHAPLPAGSPRSFIVPNG
jgi:peptidoglycan/LPS O-acetylase OafA/YrhL